MNKWWREIFPGSKQDGTGDNGAETGKPQETNGDGGDGPPIPPSRDEADSGLPPQSPQVPSVTYGVHTLHECPDATVDVCFVHGLSGDSFRTWTAEGQSKSWPEKLLPPKLKRARIVTFGYNAYIVRKSVASTNGLAEHASNLLNDLTNDRISSNAPSRPLIFVAHSLGGLVCKDAVLLSRNHPEPHLRDIFSCTKGIVFLGTPHQGSWMADWAKMPAFALGVVKSTSGLLRFLRTDDTYLKSVQDRFLSMVREQQGVGRKIDITCFFEELPLVSFGTVVSQGSATLPGYTALSIHANHSNMVKFCSAEDNGFKRLLAELTRWELKIKESAAKQPRPPIEGAHVREPLNSSSNNYGPGDMFNAPGGTASKNNFSGAAFHGTVNFGKS